MREAKVFSKLTVTLLARGSTGCLNSPLSFPPKINERTWFPS